MRICGAGTQLIGSENLLVASLFPAVEDTMRGLGFRTTPAPGKRSIAPIYIEKGHGNVIYYQPSVCVLEI